MIDNMSDLKRPPVLIVVDGETSNLWNEGTVSNTNETRVSHEVEQPSRRNCCDWIREKSTQFYNSILDPKAFLIFNIMCILQTIPALYYYVKFFIVI